MAQAIQVENGLKDFLNASLGLFQALNARIDAAQKDLLSGYNALVSRGAADKSELAQKLRGGLDQGLSLVRPAEKAAAKTTSSKPAASKPSARARV